MKKLVTLALVVVLAVSLTVNVYLINNVRSEINELKIAIKFIQAKDTAQDDVDDKLIGLLKKYFDSINAALESEGKGL